MAAAARLHASSVSNTHLPLAPYLYLPLLHFMQGILNYLLAALAAALGAEALGAEALALEAEALAAGAEAAAGALAGAAAIVAIENKLNATTVINFVIIILRVNGGWW